MTNRSAADQLCDAVRDLEQQIDILLKKRKLQRDAVRDLEQQIDILTHDNAKKQDLIDMLQARLYDLEVALDFEIDATFEATARLQIARKGSPSYAT